MEQLTEQKRIVERIRPPADPLQEMARREASFTSAPNWRQRWYRTAPEVRLALAALALAPLVLVCAIVAGMMAR